MKKQKKPKDNSVHKLCHESRDLFICLLIYLFYSISTSSTFNVFSYKYISASHPTNVVLSDRCYVLLYAYIEFICTSFCSSLSLVILSSPRAPEFVEQSQWYNSL